MNKAYSNKALPAGTVLREWRLEEVLGVGGFGIVYKGRGIYFDELVAIKEYFPSSISERDEEDTVVPIDSDAEEVHALGLKKFVEEAKLLWNLSTPSRHPNIVSVRSLFEIHGTAYMVMDFEDGVSLSRALKDGRRFNERSLWDIIRPISEGLERAHRVGVLHRDIKPPNILITPDGRPVLIDFGSARFDTAEATSTKVTFHTPPYAAIEQYVKTYEQGPWTDIYALGVVLYECVTGKKPPEVLERLHGGLGEPLASGKWPGFGKAFLSAIDSAMTIKPSERPQSISDWLAQFDEASLSGDDTEGEDEKTRFYAHEVATEEIVPVAPPVEASSGPPIETQVPADPSLAQFKRAGHDTKTSRKAELVAASVATVAAAAALPSEKPPIEPDESKLAPPPATSSKPKSPKAEPSTKKVRYGIAAAGAVAILAGAGWGLTQLRGGDGPAAAIDALPDLGGDESVLDSGTRAAGLSESMMALATEARAAGAPAAAIDGLSSASQRLGQVQVRLAALRKDPAQSAAATSLENQIKALATATNKAFANALLVDAEAKATRLSSDLPWANALAQGDTGGKSTEQRFLASALRGRFAELRSSAQAAASAGEPDQSLGAARDTLAKSRTLFAAMEAARAARLTPTRTEVAAKSETVGPAVIKPTVKVADKLKTPDAVKAAPAAISSADGVSAAKMSQFNAIIAEGRGMARQVIRADRGANGQLAKNYDKYLVTLKDSMRGVKSDAQAEQLIKQAKQTRAYLQFLVKQTT
ncbi:MAG: serine/threonine-protein kinase [Sphingomicrobium sp.]